MLHACHPVLLLKHHEHERKSPCRPPETTTPFSPLSPPIQPPLLSGNAAPLLPTARLLLARALLGMHTLHMRHERYRVRLH